MMRELYKLAIKLSGVAAIPRDRLFFNQFHYGLSFKLDEASALRGLVSHETIDHNIDIRRVWRNLGSRNSVITEQTVKNLHTAYDHFLSAKEPFKMTVSNNQIWMYANSLHFLNSFIALPGVSLPRHTEAVVNRPLNTILLKNSKYSRRTYLREQAITTEQRQRLSDFFSNYQDTVKLSPSLNRWIVYQAGRRTFGYYFIDHCDDGWLLMLSLLHPGLIRKTVEIIADK